MAFVDGHFIILCSCGVLVAQCRCPGPKVTTVKQNGCPKCAQVEKRKLAKDKGNKEDLQRGFFD